MAQAKRNRRLLWVGIAVIVIIAIGTIAYVSYPPTGPQQTVTVQQTVTPQLTTARLYKMALVAGGDETDAGWNAVAMAAANLIHEKYGWQVDISRLVPFPDQARVLTDYAQRGYDLVWAQGGQFIGDTFKVAPNFNNTIFVQVSGPDVTPPANVITLGPDFQVTGFYEAGVLAGKMTKTNNLAVVIGQWYDYLSMEFYAFRAGVQSVNPAAKVYARVAGTWGDPSLGFQIAKSLIQTKNVDIIVHIADATGRGVLTAAQQFNVTVIGTVGDQAVLAPTATLTSVMMNTQYFMEQVVQSIMDGTVRQTMAGRAVHFDLGYLAPFHDFDSKVPQSVKDLLATTQQGIKNGTIVVPRTVTENPPPDPT